MKFFRALAIGLGVATLGAGIALPIQAAVQSEHGAVPAGNKQQQGYGKDDINELCTSDRVTAPEPGMHFDGTVASTAVLAMAPGRYDYPSEGAMLLFPDGQFLLKLPNDGRDTTYGTDGSDLLGQGGIVGGCFGEQLSEAIANNSLNVDSFVLVSAYE